MLCGRLLLRSRSIVDCAFTVQSTIVLYVTSCAVGFTQSPFRRRSMRHRARDWAHHPRLSLPWSRLIVPHLAYHLGGMTLRDWPSRSSASTSISPAVDRISMLLPSAE